jgi:diacylglycerol kinase family enzyme
MRRLAAIASLLLLAAALVLTVIASVQSFPAGLTVLACLAAALVAAWWALIHAGATRLVSIALAGALLVGAIVLVVLLRSLVLDALIVVALMLALEAARRMFTVHAKLPAAPAPQRAVLFYNPKSGGGKAERFQVAREAQERGVEAIELHFGEDLDALVNATIDDGADVVGVAGGDGTQAIVAAIAAGRGIPYVCVPAGTRNHFALDLGVDRNDVVGALDAFVDGGERRVDLGDVNGRVFVNNVSIGVYANAVQQQGYRDQKIRTLLESASADLGSQAAQTAIRWRGQDGEEGRDAVVLVVSNNLYRLGTVIGAGTRPRLDEGVLGVAVASTGAPGRAIVPAGVALRQWQAPSFTVDADGPVAAGIDGEAVTLSPPVRFASREGVLTVRIAADHPGASPSTDMPPGLAGTVALLVRIAIGRGPEANGDSTHAGDGTGNRSLPSRSDSSAVR